MDVVLSLLLQMEVLERGWVFQRDECSIRVNWGGEVFSFMINATFNRMI